MTAADTVITDNSGAVAANNNVGGDLNQHVKIVQQYFREFVRKHLLDPDHVTELLRTYEPPPDRDQAADVLGRRHAVVLVGGEGTGRRTTAVQLLHERNVALHELDLESGRDLVEPPCEPRCGYLLAADVLDPAVVQDYATRLGAEDSYLVVWTTHDVTQEAGTFLAEIGIHLHPPLTEGVFRRNVDVRLHPAEAAWWRACQDLEPLVKGARPADVVRLVELIQRTGAVHGCTDTAVTAVIDAYRNWETYLQAKFAPAALELRERVRLIAVAMIEDAPEPAAYEAVTALGEKLGVPAEEGHGLAGAGARCFHGGGEISCEDGAVRFVRPAFAESVLDYVARTYPRVWERVREWAIELPGRLHGDPDAPRVIARLARTVAKLAVRQDDLGIVRWAVEEWSVDLASRPFAAEVLGMAAVDPASGRRIRQWMYYSAYYRQGTDATRIAIAEACAQYGTVYPENAVTRLRHLSAADSESVRTAVRHAAAGLAGDVRIRARVIDAFGRWVSGTKGRAVGCDAFLDVMEARDDQDRVLVIGEAAQRGAGNLAKALQTGWRAALIEPATTWRARAVIGAWLDDAVRTQRTGDERRARTAVRILGRASGEDARYLPRLIAAVDAWYALAVPDLARTDLRRAVIETASSADPLITVRKGGGAA